MSFVVVKLFTVVLELIRIHTIDILWKLRYANDLPVVANRDAGHQGELIEWKDLFT